MERFGKNVQLFHHVVLRRRLDLEATLGDLRRKLSQDPLM
jgi:hypothetical protein